MTSPVRLLPMIAMALVASMSIQAQGYLTPDLLIAAKMDGARDADGEHSGTGCRFTDAEHRPQVDRRQRQHRGISGVITGAHIHEGAVGVAESIVVDLKPTITRDHITTTITGADLAKLSMAKLLTGRYYINVHTPMHPTGEIRRQLRLESDYGYRVRLDGAQETPAVATYAVGLGTFDLSQSDSLMTINVVVSALRSQPIIGVHLHRGAPGVAGPIVVDLSDSIRNRAIYKGNWISATINPRAILADLRAGNIYVNIQTADYPSGEIRGQLIPDSSALPFDAVVSGNGMAIADLALNPTLDTLRYSVVVDTLDRRVTEAYFGWRRSSSCRQTDQYQFGDPWQPNRGGNHRAIAYWRPRRYAPHGRNAHRCILQNLYPGIDVEDFDAAVYFTATCHAKATPSPSTAGRWFLHETFEQRVAA